MIMMIMMILSNCQEEEGEEGLFVTVNNSGKFILQLMNYSLVAIISLFFNSRQVQFRHADETNLAKGPVPRHAYSLELC